VYGFTGEQTDPTGLVYLRARMLDPAQGRFLSRDGWPDDPKRPRSLNKWVYVGNNPVNAVDPLGLALVRIWAAAFIEPEEIEFPYPDPFSYAIWKGDNRDFYDGTGNNRSSRVWHEVLLNLDPLHSFVWYNDADAGRTRAIIFSRFGVIEKEDKATPPPRANVTIYKDTCVVDVDIEASVHNALLALSPPIEYDYHIEFDMVEKTVRYTGSHKKFPWHELIVLIDGILVVKRHEPPSGPFRTPVDLFPVFGKVVWTRTVPAEIPSDFRSPCACLP
jgi:RHS repeat-associated protein